MKTTWNIRRLVDETIDPATQHIILKIVRFKLILITNNKASELVGPLLSKQIVVQILRMVSGRKPATLCFKLIQGLY